VRGVKVLMVIEGIYAWLVVFLGFSIISGIPIYKVTYKSLKLRQKSELSAKLLSVVSSYLPIVFLIFGLLLAKSYTSFNGLFFWGPLVVLGGASIAMRVWFDFWSGASKEIPLYNHGKP
jgi:hypothetical protein